MKLASVKLLKDVAIPNTNTLAASFKHPEYDLDEQNGVLRITRGAHQRFTPLSNVYELTPLAEDAKPDILAQLGGPGPLKSYGFHIRETIVIPPPKKKGWPKGKPRKQGPPAGGSPPPDDAG